MMKKAGLMMTFVLFAFIGKAQTQSGGFLVGGGMSFSSTSFQSGADTQTNFEIHPKVGYFIADNIALGLDLGYGASGGRDKATTFEVGPFIRFYKPLGESSFYFYGEGNIRAGFGKSAAEVKSSTVYFGVSPGIAYFFNDKFSLDFAFEGISYEVVDPNKDNDRDRRNIFTFGLDSFKPTLGFYYFFGR
jgi:hypothetical protein